MKTANEIPFSSLCLILFMMFTKYSVFSPPHPHTHTLEKHFKLESHESILISNRIQVRVPFLSKIALSKYLLSIIFFSIAILYFFYNSLFSDQKIFRVRPWVFDVTEKVWPRIKKLHSKNAAFPFHQNVMKKMERQNRGTEKHERKPKRTVQMDTVHHCQSK